MPVWVQTNWALLIGHLPQFIVFGLLVCAATIRITREYFKDRIAELTDQRDHAFNQRADPASSVDEGMPEDVKAANNAGLIDAYQNRQQAMPAIEKAVVSAEKVWVLSNKGTDWVGEHGILDRPLKKRWAGGQHVRLRMLLLHPRSPWLTGRANKKGWIRDCNEAAAAFRNAHKEVLEFASHYPDVEPVKFHKLDPSWRFVMTDKEVFIQTYKTISKVIDERVLQFSCDSTIYKSAFRFFEYVYELDSAEKGELSAIEALRQKQLKQRISSGCVLTRHREGRLEALVLFKDGQVALPKGGIEDSETSPIAALRELEEETGVETKPISVRSLVFLHWVCAGQPDLETLTVKGIIFYHCHLADGVDLSDPQVGARWCDQAALDGEPWRYSYVPEVLAKVGIRPRWTEPPHRESFQS